MATVETHSPVHMQERTSPRALARLAQASTLGTATAIPRIHQPTGTTVPDDHVLGFLDSGPEDNDAVRTVLLLLDAARAERQRHDWGGDPYPAIYAPLEGDENWAPWTPRAFAATAEQAQLQLDAQIGDVQMGPASSGHASFIPPSGIRPSQRP